MPRNSHALCWWSLLLAVGLGPSCSKPSSPQQSAVVSLASPSGKHFLGEQLSQFEVAQDGVITSTRNSWLYIYHTEGKPFRLSGEVWLGGSSAKMNAADDYPDGFALFLREWDSLHRYSCTTRNLQVKRRRHSGQQERGIKELATFQPAVLEQWIAFSLEARSDVIAFQIGGQSATIQGPLDMDGGNKIVLGPGTKAKALKLEILE